MNDNPLFQALRELCQFLDDSDLSYTLVGGLAVGIWSAPRVTVDVDFTRFLRCIILLEVVVEDFMDRSVRAMLLRNGLFGRTYG